jgi:hypothetical protein
MSSKEKYVFSISIYLPTDLIRLNSSILPPRLLGSRVPRSRSGFELDSWIETLPAKRTPKLRPDFHDIMKIQGKRDRKKVNKAVNAIVLDEVYDEVIEEPKPEIKKKSGRKRKSYSHGLSQRTEKRKCMELDEQVKGVNGM